MFWPPVPAKAQFITRAVPAGLAWTLGAGAGGVALIAFLAASTAGKRIQWGT